MTTSTDKPKNAEQAADLAALQTQAAEGAPAPGAPGAAPAQPGQNSLQVAALAVGMMRPIIGYAVPALRTAPEELWQPVPEGVAAVLDHYNLGADWMNSPWARLAVSLAPLAAYAAMNAEKPDDKPAPLAAPVPAPDPAPAQAGSDRVSFGAPVPAPDPAQAGEGAPA